MSSTDMPQPGDAAPSFELPESSGGTVSLADLRGQWVVLYFYPGDSSSGCAAQAMAFSEMLPEFKKRGCAVYGISGDDAETHTAFREENDLSVALLSDTEKTASTAYGTWQEQNLFGTMTWVIQRATFLIDPDGVVQRCWPRVRVAGHARKVVRELDSQREAREKKGGSPSISAAASTSGTHTTPEHTSKPEEMPDPMRHEDDSKTVRPLADGTVAAAPNPGAAAASMFGADHRPSSLRNVRAVMGRELLAYFTSPIALVVFVIFHISAVLLTFEGGLGGVPLWERGYADLEQFYRLLPWLLLVFVPALSMRLWAEERQTGSIEMLLTLPMRRAEIVLGKFLGAWVILAAMLFLPAATLTMIMLYIGTPDVGQIVSAFLGAILMAGSYLALGSVLSAVTRDQIVAFVTTIIAGAAFSFVGNEGVRTWLTGLDSGGADAGTFADTGARAAEGGGWAIGSTLAEIAERISLSARFEELGRGQPDLADIAYYGLFIVFCLYLTGVILRLKR